MQMKGKYSWAKHLDFMLVDLFSLLLAFCVAYYIKFRTLTMNDEWRRFIVIITLFNLLIYFAANPYSGIFRRRYYHEIGRGAGVVASNAVCVTILVYVLKIGIWYSRQVFVVTYLLYFILTTLLKYFWKKVLTSRLLGLYKPSKRSLLLICDEEHAERDIHSIYSTELPLYDIKGTYLVRRGKKKTAPLPDVLSYQEEGVREQVPVVKCDLVRFVLQHNISEVLVAAAPGTIAAADYQTLIANGVTVNFVVEALLGFQSEEQFVANIGVNKALSVGEFSFTPLQGFYLLVKRVFDIICGLLGILVLIPLTMLVKLAYLLSGDTARILYRQQRVGLNGKPFYLWKFRSMVPDAGELLEQLLLDEDYRKEWEENQKLENDPRITKIGAFLRKTSIDELPQLVNVLCGDMSLIGPRPLVEGELEAHNGLKLYQKVKPGITGWWGCNGRSNIDYRERLDLEYYYVKHCSLYLDLLCIIRTVFVVVQGGGAV